MPSHSSLLPSPHISNITAATNTIGPSIIHAAYNLLSGGRCAREDDLQVCHFTENSFRSRIEVIKLYLASQSFFHVIAVRETKLGEIVGYELYCQDRNTISGGVALFIHMSLPTTRLCSSAGSWAGKSGLPEYLFCETAPSPWTFFQIRRTPNVCET